MKPIYGSLLTCFLQLVYILELLHFLLLFIITTLAPGVIVYDAACLLHAYCLNRDPLFFKDTKFLCDVFHWKNHTGISYTMPLLPY